MESKCLEKFRQEGRVIGTRVVAQAEAELLGFGDAALVLEHDRIPFVSYPYEWTLEMLEAAGNLTLDLAEALLKEGLGLKDATPFNVLFRGPTPVFVDALSVERRADRDPLWRPLAQFERTFLYPLLAHKACGLGLGQTLGVNREGLEPEEMAKLVGPVRRWAPPYLWLATIPATLGKRKDVENPALYRKREAASVEQAQFILERRFRGARKSLRQVAPNADMQSGWSDYQGQSCHYSAEDRTLKQKFVEEALKELPTSATVLDIGANLGEYSRTAAGMGHGVVAIDMDTVTMGRLWRGVHQTKEKVLPLVVDLASPTPATGWENGEGLSFLDRAKGQFDCVLMLAVVHHLLVTNRVPLEHIVNLVAELTKKVLIVEYVGLSDPLFQRLCRGREALHKDFTLEEFERKFGEKFTLVKRGQVQGNGRVVYWFRKVG